MGKAIPLTKGFETIVDEKWYPMLSQVKWHSRINVDGTVTAVRNGDRNDKGNQKTERIHRLITDCPKHMDVDHINGNTLDNRECNLRICTAQENCRNSKHKPKKKTSVKYKGVNPKGSRYQASIGVNYNRIYLGSYKTEKEAARAYNEAAIKYHGEFCKLNNIEE